METISDVKLAKFKIRLEELEKNFCVTANSALVRKWHMPFCLPITDRTKLAKYLYNPYIKAIRDVFFCRTLIGNAAGPNLAELTEELKKMKLYNTYTCKSSSFMGIGTDEVGVETCNIKGMMMFLALLLLTIDDDFYKNEINMVSDLAEALDFNENMMTDWAAAVKFWLDGNDIKSSDIKFKTSEAMSFFKRIPKFMQGSTEMSVQEETVKLNLFR